MNSNGYKIWIDHRAANGVHFQKIYLVAISNWGALVKAMCDQLKLNDGMFLRHEVVSAALLQEHQVKAGTIKHLMDFWPPGENEDGPGTSHQQ